MDLLINIAGLSLALVVVPALFLVVCSRMARRNFPFDQPVPYELIRRVVRMQADHYAKR